MLDHIADLGLEITPIHAMSMAEKAESCNRGSKLSWRSTYVHEPAGKLGLNMGRTGSRGTDSAANISERYQIRPPNVGEVPMNWFPLAAGVEM